MRQTTILGLIALVAITLAWVICTPRESVTEVESKETYETSKDSLSSVIDTLKAQVIELKRTNSTNQIKINRYTADISVLEKEIKALTRVGLKIDSARISLQEAPSLTPNELDTYIETNITN